VDAPPPPVHIDLPAPELVVEDGQALIRDERGVRLARENED
jgi:hypothetical protein